VEVTSPGTKTTFPPDSDEAVHAIGVCTTYVNVADGSMLNRPLSAPVDISHRMRTLNAEKAKAVSEIWRESRGIETSSHSTSSS
jgi:hypothetical protein